MDAVVLAAVFAIRMAGYEPVDVPIDDVQCLTRTVYHEARGEPLSAQIAVAHSVLQRGRDVCAVISKPKQYSWYARKRLKEDRTGKEWAQSAEVAALAYAGGIDAPFYATHFTDTDTRRVWMSGMVRVATVGNFKFMRRKDT